MPSNYSTSQIGLPWTNKIAIVFFLFNTWKKWKIIKKPSNVSVTANSGKHLPVSIRKKSYQNIGKLKVTLPPPHTVYSQFGEIHLSLRKMALLQSIFYYQTTSLHQTLIVFFSVPDLNEYDNHECHDVFDIASVRCRVKHFTFTYMVLFNPHGKHTGEYCSLPDSSCGN